MIDTLVKANAQPNMSGWTNARQIVHKSNGELWCVYTRHDGTHYQIYISYSTDDGATWTEEQISYGTDNQYDAALVVDSDDNLHVTWTGLGWGANPTKWQVQYRKRTAAGWQAQEAVTDDIVHCGIYGHALGIDSNDNLHVVYSWYNGYHQIAYRKRTSGGWQTQENVTNYNTYPTALTYPPSIGIDSGNNVHMAWSRQNKIRYKKRTSIWLAEEIVNEAIADSKVQRHCCIAIDTSDDIHVVWQGTGWGDWLDSYNIQYRKKMAGVWQPQEHVTNTDADKGYACISLEKTTGYLWVSYGGVVNGVGSWYRKRTSSWQAETYIANAIKIVSIWGMHPDAVNPNYPPLGCAFIYQLGTSDVRYRSDSLIWIPIVSTNAANNITEVEATLNAVLTNDGGEACDCGFQWGETVAYGNTTPTQSKTTGEIFSQVISSLTHGTLYHFRAFATNSGGTGYGNDMYFVTESQALLERSLVLQELLELLRR